MRAPRCSAPPPALCRSAGRLLAALPPALLRAASRSLSIRWPTVLTAPPPASDIGVEGMHDYEQSDATVLNYNEFIAKILPADYPKRTKMYADDLASLAFEDRKRCAAPPLPPRGRSRSHPWHHLPLYGSQLLRVPPD